MPDRLVDPTLNARRIRASLCLAVTLALIMALVGTVPRAAADTVPIIPSEAASVSTDSLPTAQIGNGVVWRQIVVGDIVYAGGNFSSARPAGSAAGTNTVTRTHLLAYNITTGALTSFAPTLNAEVRSLAASPDGTRLYVGGYFTTVNGVSRNRIAAFDTATGALVSSFNPSANYFVSAIVANDTTVWFGGGFSTVAGQTRMGAAAVAASNAALQPWAPVLGGGKAYGIALSPDQTKIVLGGNFTSLNGGTNPGYGLGMVSSTGAGTTNLPFKVNSLIRNAGPNGSITSIHGDANGVYGTGYDFGSGANFEGTFRASWADGTLIWVEDCHGDTYSAWASAGLVYKAGHIHYCGNIGGFPETSPRSYKYGLGFTVAATGIVAKNAVGNYYNFGGNPAPSLINWFPEFNTGTFTGQGQGPWSVAGDSRYAVYGGEFTRVNNKAQQGLARFAVKEIAPNKDGPRLSGADLVPTATSRAPGVVTLSWPANHDRDNEWLTYRIIRNGAVVGETTAASRFWIRPTLTFTDDSAAPGETYTYSIRALDPFGNTVNGNSITATAASGTPLLAYAKGVLGDNPRHYWRLGETSGTSSADIANGVNLTTGSGVTRNVAGALSGDTNRASRFNGLSNGYASTTTSQSAPQIFSVEAWFKSSSLLGGKIIGFGNSSSTPGSSLTDRHVFLDSAGKLNFGVFSGANRLITSAASFNNNQWHHVVATLDNTGMRLYADGVLVASRTDTISARVTSGFWRVGGDSAWSGHGYLSGDIDEAAVYHNALSAGEVANHYSIGTGAEPVNQPPTASFTVTTSDLTASFNGSASSDPDGSIASWAWNYGDGATGSGETSSHTYAAEGTYTATLTVTDNGGETASTTGSVTVSAAPSPAGTLAADDFERTVSGGWGTATTGGAWTLTGGASNFSVGSGVGKMTASVGGQNLVAGLTSVSSTSTDVTFRTTHQQAVTGSSAYITAIGRAIGSDDYRARVVFSPDTGKVNLQLQRGTTTLQAATVAGITYAAGESLQVRLQVVGTSPTTIQAKVWRTGTAEPSAWTLTTTDSTAAMQSAGSIGLGFYIGASSTGLPRTATFDDYKVTTVP